MAVVGRAPSCCSSRARAECCEPDDEDACCGDQGCNCSAGRIREDEGGAIVPVIPPRAR